MKYALAIFLMVSTVSFANPDGERMGQGGNPANPAELLEEQGYEGDPSKDEVPPAQTHSDDYGIWDDDKPREWKPTRPVNEIGMTLNEPITEVFSKYFRACAKDCRVLQHYVRGHRNQVSCVPTGRTLNLFSIQCGSGSNKKNHTAIQGGRFAEVLSCIDSKFRFEASRGRGASPALKTFYVNKDYKTSEPRSYWMGNTIYRQVGYISMGCHAGQGFRW